MGRVLLVTAVFGAVMISSTGAVNAADMPPRADAGPDRTVLVGERVSFDAAQSKDPDGNIIDYRWDFNDRTQAIGVTADHVFWRPGTYRVKLSVRDDSQLDGNTHTDEAVVTVNRRPNTAPKAVTKINGAVTARAGSPIYFDGAGSHDANGNILKYDWDFGNGAKAIGVSPVYTYQEPGRYTVTLKVTDDYTNPAGTHQTQFTVSVTPRDTGTKEKK